MSSPTTKTKAVALYEFQTGDKNHMPMNVGEEFVVVNDTNPDWILVSKDKKKGYVPRTYVELKEITVTITLPTTPTTTPPTITQTSITTQTSTTSTDPKIIEKKTLRSKTSISPQPSVSTIKKRVKISAKKLTTETDILTNPTPINPQTPSDGAEDEEVGQIESNYYKPRTNTLQLSPESSVIKNPRTSALKEEEEKETSEQNKKNPSPGVGTSFKDEGKTLNSARGKPNSDNRKSKAPNMLSFLPSNSKYVPNSNIKKMMSKNEASGIIQRFTFAKFINKKFKETYTKGKIYKDSRIRKQLIKEIYETEKEYVHSLEVIMSVYYVPLRKNKKFIEQESIDQIFGSLPSIQGLQQNMLNMMETQMAQYCPLIGQVFVDMALYLKIYPEYINSYDESISLLTELIETKRGFAAFLEKQSCSPECEGLSIEGFLIKPVQRIPRYKLLLRDLLKLTPSNHIDFENIKIAYEKIDFVAGFVNEQKRAAENQKIVLNLTSSMSHETKESILKPNRRLVKHGNLKIVNQLLENEFTKSSTINMTNPTSGLKINGEYHCYLFTDMFLLTKESPNSKEYVETTQIHLEFSVLEVLMDSKQLLLSTIVSGTKYLFTISFEQNEAETWIKIFGQTVQELKERASKNSSIPLHELETLEEKRLELLNYHPASQKKKKHLEERYKHKQEQISTLKLVLESNTEKLKKLQDLIAEQTQELANSIEDSKDQKLKLEEITAQVKESSKKVMEIDKKILEVLNNDQEKYKDIFDSMPITDL